MKDQTPYVWTLADAEAIGRFMAEVERQLNFINVWLMMLALCAVCALGWLLLAPKPAHAEDLKFRNELYVPDLPVITNCAAIYFSDHSSYLDSVAARALRGERTQFLADTLMNYMESEYPGFRYEWPLKKCAYKCFLLLNGNNLCMDEQGNWSRPRPEHD